MLKLKTNLADWSALMPVLPGEGPRTRELYACLRRLIETGLAPPGSKLPTTRDLARRLGLSRASAVAAFEMLAAEGFVEPRVGAGTFVAPQVPVVAEASRSELPNSAKLNSPAYQQLQPLLCDLGVAFQDSRSMRIFRASLSRHLARPGLDHFSYGDARGGLLLREALAAYLGIARGVRCDADQIVVTSGTMHGLDLVTRAVTGPGDAIWIEDPCYPMARAVLEGGGGRVIGIPVDSEGLDPIRGEVICPQARLVYVTPSHQFPLGVTMTMRRRLALIEWARRNDAWIVEDDYDSEFRYAGPPLTALQGMDGSERVAYLGTFAKVLFPGLRIGYAVVPRPLLQAVLRLRKLSDRQPPTLAEGAVADFLNEGHLAAHLRRVRRRVQAARDRLFHGLQARCEGRLAVTMPEQGLHLVARLLQTGSDRQIASALKAAGVGTRALSPMFLAARPEQGLVLGFSGFNDEQLHSAVLKISEALGQGSCAGLRAPSSAR